MSEGGARYAAGVTGLLQHVLLKPFLVRRENRLIDSSGSSAPLKEFPHITLSDHVLLIGTTSGIWHLSRVGLYQLTTPMTYGITRIGSVWYAHQATGSYSRIVAFRLTNKDDRPMVADFHILKTGLSQGIHQIAGYQHMLYICDTLKNRIIRMDTRGKSMRCYYPAGRASAGATHIPQKYCHFNSLYPTNDTMYVIAHNMSRKTGRLSQLYECELNTFRIRRIRDIPAQCAHNILFYKHNALFCDSLGGTLVLGNRVIFQECGKYLRGLALAGSDIMVGGSPLAERSDRRHTEGLLFWLDRAGKLVEKVVIPESGQILEIRAGDRNECGSDFSQETSP